jgi:hypothetical protein
VSSSAARRRAGGLASDKLEVVAGLDVDDANTDALHAGFALAIEGYPQRR